ncbi:histidine phosphotransferase family protein [Thalassobaculum sp. OXR-137]|uniref:histidine phosphotransferase family protein n=1 Tax=Thalassobaculum sp. OXR-137 TaxID=3100173 RepID=UPI002AC8BF67|nr:histidine phosphotransferase family protein [Thalassobaculum sp. OXR-137]WPZ32607.1 histidine phosphotransferase family protein [Thalassobaculum sp. OXR-137]
MSISPRHLDLLLSRLFHDLIGPASAARNGLELVREFGGDDVGAEAMDLVAGSVDQVAARLTFFRMAFGGAGSGGGIEFLDARPVLADYLSHRKLEPRIAIADGLARPAPGVIKLVLGLAVVAAESLPRGGVVSVSATAEEVRIEAEGRDAALSDKAAQALAGTLEPEDEVLVVPATVGITARRFEIGYDVVSAAPPRFVVRLV